LTTALPVGEGGLTCREPARVAMAPVVWPLATACLALFGTATPEIVFDWQQRRFRREVDHAASLAWRE